MKICAMAVSIVLAAGWVASTAAQDAYTWSDINCAESRLVALPNGKCRATNIVSGGSDGAGGQFRRWSTFSASGPYAFISMHEALIARSHIFTRQTGIEYLKAINAVARDGVEFGDVQRHDGADYYLFKSSARNECVGFRRYGPVRGEGYAWIMGGVTCEPNRAPLSKPRVSAFIEAGKVR